MTLSACESGGFIGSSRTPVNNTGEGIGGGREGFFTHAIAFWIWSLIDVLGSWATDR